MPDVFLLGVLLVCIAVVVAGVFVVAGAGAAMIVGGLLVAVWLVAGFTDDPPGVAQ